MDEEEAQGHFALAVALLWHREHDKALVEARRCVALEPNSAEGHIAVAHILTYSGKAEAAISTIDAYMKLDPFYKDIVLYFLAEARISLGQIDEAVAALNRRLERNPNSETSYALLASCYGQLGRFEDARAAWAEVLRISPNFSIERRRHILTPRLKIPMISSAASKECARLAFRRSGRAKVHPIMSPFGP